MHTKKRTQYMVKNTRQVILLMFLKIMMNRFKKLYLVQFHHQTRYVLKINTHLYN